MTGKQPSPRAMQRSKRGRIH